VKSLDERGRKFVLTVIAVPFFLLVIASAYVQALVPALHDLDLPIIAGAAAGVAGLAAVYSGANAWAKQSEAKIAEQETIRTTYTQADEDLGD
jgi:hypothetical protein